jgi:nucleoside 2-deoxyribosyltransferase
MSETAPLLLLLGEIYVDFTVTEPGTENKLRLGGIAHAARGFWALGIPFNVAAILPEYLEASARKYFEALGCADFRVVGRIRGAPNVIAIFDPTEVADQEYDTLLRDEKTIELLSATFTDLACKEVLLFPGSYDLTAICAALPKDACLHIDVAYDIETVEHLLGIPQRIQTIFISTSSSLFKALNNDNFVTLIKAFEPCKPAALILKENRGGARMFIYGNQMLEPLPALLGSTINSVGVGDVFDAAYVGNISRGLTEASWRATYAAAAYSQTTDPDLFKTYVARDLKLSLEEMQNLEGAHLPWEKRRQYPIYLAAPDFSYVDRRCVEKTIASLQYHNFLVRRPVVENGELPYNSKGAALLKTYLADYELLKQCKLLFAVPIGRDPGTLVEIGIAIEANIPVVVYDPTKENSNPMVICGAHYSSTLDDCLDLLPKLSSFIRRVCSGYAPLWGVLRTHSV